MPFEPSALFIIIIVIFLTEVLMCLRSRIRTAHLRVLIGLAVVGSLVVFTYESAYIKQKYASRFNASASAGKKSVLSLVVGCKPSLVLFFKKLTLPV